MVKTPMLIGPSGSGRLGNGSIVAQHSTARMARSTWNIPPHYADISVESSGNKKTLPDLPG
jgi:hypothetical protein